MTNPELDQGGQEALLRQQEIFHEKVYLNELLINELDQNGDLTKEIANEIQRDIDENCPYIDKAVLISGRALVSKFDDETQNIIGVEWVDVEHIGIHMGVNIVSEDEFDHHFILQQVYLCETLNQPLPTVIQNTKIFAFFDNDATIMPIEELETSFISSGYNEDHQDSHDVEILIQKLVRKSEGFRDVLKSKRFRNLSLPRQKSFVARSLQLISETVPFLVQSDVGIEAEYGYVPDLKEDGSLDYQVIDMGRAAVFGTCLGIDTIEAASLDIGPIKKMGELIDSGAGLQLVIDPSEDTRTGLDISDGKVIFIPTANQPVHLEIIKP